MTEAAPLVWQIFELNPSRIEQVRDLIGGFLDSQLDREAVMLAEKLEHFQRRKGERRAFLAMMQDIVAGHKPSVEMLEFLADQFNTANREADYCSTLLRLFDLYCQQGNHAKAGDALDRAAEIDPYESGHQKRLEMLKGKIEQNRYEVIASRFTGTAATPPVRNDSTDEDKTLGSGTLQDLMLQAEILVQYGMRNKALERLQRIQHLHCRAHRLPNIGFAVRRRDEPRLELRRRKVNPLRQHSVEKSFESFAVAVHRVGKVVHRPLCEISAEHRSAAIELHRYLRLPGCVLDSRFELSAEPFEMLVNVGVPFVRRQRIDLRHDALIALRQSCSAGARLQMGDPAVWYSK